MKIRNPFRSRAHRHDYRPVAARPSHMEPGGRHMFGEQPDRVGTLVLYRCACGDIATKMFAGVWTATELGVPCNDAAAVESLLRGGKP